MALVTDLLGCLAGRLRGLLLCTRHLGELGAGPLQRASRVDDGQDKESYHHREGVEGVAVGLVKGDWVGRRDTAGEFVKAVDDADLGGVSGCEL